MTPERIRELGAAPYRRILRPLKRQRRSVATVYGLDTEYTQAGELVCWTVSGPGGEVLYDTPLTVEALEWHVERTEPEAREAVFVSYFSLAELQFFDLAAEAKTLRLFGRGSTDAGFASRRGEVAVSIIDVARFFDGQPLKEAAASFGLEKLEQDVSNVTREDLKDRKFRDYALRDARLARIIFERLRSEWLDLGIDLLVYPTAASAAAALWRSKYLEADHGRGPTFVRRHGLRCSWGGRAEAFRRGFWPTATELDLKSAYPRAVVSYGAFPRPQEWREERRVNALCDAKAALCVVDFEFPKSELFPCLPVMLDGRMIFPLRGRSSCTGDELALAAERGAKLWIVSGIAADAPSDDSPQRFMVWAMETRAKVKGTARAYVAKLAANSLTGKWAQNRDGIDFDRLLEESNARGVRPRSLLGLGPLERKELGIAAEPILGGAFWPEAYALTTGRVRARLGRALIATGSPLYCATDSVWAEGRAEPPGDEWDTKAIGPAAVARTRLARIETEDGGEHLAFHGVANQDAARELLSRFSLSAPEEARVEYSVRRPIGLREGLRKDDRPGRWIVEKDRKATTDWDRKRRLVDGGWSVPWNIAEESR